MREDQLLTDDERFAEDLVERRMAPDAKPKNDMMQAFIKAGMTKDQLIQQVYIHV